MQLPTTVRHCHGAGFETKVIDNIAVGALIATCSISRKPLQVYVAKVLRIFQFLEMLKVQLYVVRLAFRAIDQKAMGALG